MSLSRFEKLVYLGCPWLFGTVLMVCGLVVASKRTGAIEGLLLICCSLVILSIWCLCSLIAKALPLIRREIHEPQITSA